MSAGPASAGRDWDAASYDRVSDPQYAWGLEVLERLPLAGDETVLDAGCGSGRVTAALLERLPRGRVIGVDAAQSMVEHARGALDGRATVLRADLVELSLPEPVDASSRTPSSTGSRTTTRCSRASTPRCGPVGGSRPSAAGRATSTA